MTVKRVSFIQSLLADPEKKKKLMVDSIIAIQAREGIKTTREQAEAAYAKAQSRPNSSRIESSPVAPKRVELSRDGDSGELRIRRTSTNTGREADADGPVPRQGGGTRHSEATAEGSGVVRPDGRRPVVADSEGRLDRIQSVTGVLRGFDGYCVWGTNGSFDVRDIGNRVGLSMRDVVEALPDFKPVVRGAITRDGVAGNEGRLERIQRVTGLLRAYDGRYCVWGANGSFDVRDIGNRVGLSMQDVVDALPDFTPVKRGRASVTPDEDSTE